MTCVRTMHVACHANARPVSITSPNSKIRLFLDTADTAQWQKWAETGLPPTFHGLTGASSATVTAHCRTGITTNPLILKRDGVPCQLKDLRNLTMQVPVLHVPLPTRAYTNSFAQAAFMGYQELQLQTWGPNIQTMVDNGLHLHSFTEFVENECKVVVKVPATADGLRAAWQLGHTHGVPVTLTGMLPIQHTTTMTPITGLYNSAQVLHALSCGVEYAAPYLGRMNDAGRQVPLVHAKNDGNVKPDVIQRVWKECEKTDDQVVCFMFCVLPLCTVNARCV